MLKTAAFQPWGVWPICADISATWVLTESNIPERLLIMPPTSISFSQVVIASSKKSIRFYLLSAPPASAGGAKVWVFLVRGWF